MLQILPMRRRQVPESVEHRGVVPEVHGLDLFDAQPFESAFIGDCITLRYHAQFYDDFR